MTVTRRVGRRDVSHDNKGPPTAQNCCAPELGYKSCCSCRQRVASIQHTRPEPSPCRPQTLTQSEVGGHDPRACSCMECQGDTHFQNIQMRFADRLNAPLGFALRAPRCEESKTPMQWRLPMCWFLQNYTRCLWLVSLPLGSKQDPRSQE